MSSQVNITLADESGVTAIVSIGSNLPSRFGSPAATVKEAVEYLEALSRGPLAVSSVYCTAAVNCPPDTPDFSNAIAAFRPNKGLTAAALLRELFKIEAAFERKRGDLPNLPRTLDLDLICYGTQEIRDACLILPHPRAHQRRFVMEPLAELAPDLILPGQAVTVQQLLQQLPTTPLPG
jgi:2-amino-4-hydroxy-6-hydroxymethyldihydropteridine diphosphokinase